MSKSWIITSVIVFILFLASVTTVVLFIFTDPNLDPNGDTCLMHGGVSRCWQVYVPDGRTGSVPLVIDMHGYGSNPNEQRFISGFEAFANKDKFIVVWPYGLKDSDGLDAWNAGTCCSSDISIDDVSFLRAMISKVSGLHSIDANRIYATGLSNGCAMAHRMGNEASDIIAAVGCMSFYSLVPEAASYTPVSLMEVHGTDDDVIKYVMTSPFPGARENQETWRQMNGCTGLPEETWRSGNSFASTYINCSDDTEVSLVTIDKAGHIPYKGINTDIDTTQLIWDFMKRFSN